MNVAPRLTLTCCWPSNPQWRSLRGFCRWSLASVFWFLLKLFTGSKTVPSDSVASLATSASSPTIVVLVWFGSSVSISTWNEIYHCRDNWLIVAFLILPFTRWDCRNFTHPRPDGSYQYAAEVCRDFGAELKESNGDVDHVHMLIEYPPTVQLSVLVNSLKAVTSRRLRNEFLDLRGAYGKAVLWSRSYFAGSCGGAPLEVVKQYIQHQRGWSPFGLFKPVKIPLPPYAGGSTLWKLRWGRVSFNSERRCKRRSRYLVVEAP